MENLIIEPDFFVDFNGQIGFGPLVISGETIVAVGSDAANFVGRRVRLLNQVVMPGFVNCHSHAFQRALRGLVEKKEAKSTHDNFWTWRKKMYALLSQMTSDDIRVITHLTYLEMLEAGFTHVGEFHYVHHNLEGLPYDDPLTMSMAIVKASLDAKINLCLLECAYNRHSFSDPLKPEQKRFGFETVDDYLAFVKKAHESLRSKTTDVGVAIHSVRAVPHSWFSPIKDFASFYNMPVHVHVSEQEQEVMDCLNRTNRSPIELLHNSHLLSPTTTLVHATHLIGDDAQLIRDHGPHVCICPSTEKNLGDGVIPLDSIKNVPICIGTDQHVRLDPFGEALSLEEQERLRTRKRGVLIKPEGYLYEALLPSLLKSGMKSLYPTFDDTSLVNKPANLISLELPPEYLWHGPQAALDAMLLSYNPSKIENVLTNGHFVLQDGELTCDEKPYLLNYLRTFFHKVIS